jgi:6-pyruvoyltetrahydropterin/6-carboxytetrahydropterin synthase
MYEVTIRKSFSAAHTLTIGGKCEELHGHNFAVDVTAGSPVLNREGVVIDFRLLKEWLDDILENIDHKYLNDLPGFQEENPSSEIIARFIYDRMVEKAEAHTVEIVKVAVWESDNAFATYRGGNSG